MIRTTEMLQTLQTPEIQLIDIKNEIVKLANSDLTNFTLSASKRCLTFEITTGPQGANYTIQLFDLVHLIFSQTPNDEAPYFVGEVTVTILSDGGEKVLPALNYGFRDKGGKPASFPSLSLYHVHLDGGVTFEVICERIQVSKFANDNLDQRAVD